MIRIPTKIAAGASLVAWARQPVTRSAQVPLESSARWRPRSVSPLKVRTQTIRRTVRIVKHQRPRREPPAPPVLMAGATYQEVHSPIPARS